MSLKNTFFLLFLACFQTFCLAQNDTIFEIPSDYIYPIFNIKNELLGENTNGSPLKSKILNNNFIVIGETHGVHESTTTINLIAQLKSFDRFITEIDSFSLHHLSDNIGNSTSLLRNDPGAYAMYSYLEELDLIKTLKLKEVQLEGIDLIHPLSMRLILQTLLQSAEIDKKSIKSIERLLKRHAYDLKKGFLSSKTVDQTTRLLRYLHQQVPPSEKPLIEYALDNRYPSNQMEARANHMRRRLEVLASRSDFLNEHILFKFGGSHTLKTYNTAGKQDLGAYLNSLHEKQAVEAFFLAIVPVNGITGLPLEINGVSTQKFDLNSRFYRELSDLYKSIGKTEPLLFVDLESFRQERRQDHIISKALQIILNNYDGIIFIREVTPSKI